MKKITLLLVAIAASLGFVKAYPKAESDVESRILKIRQKLLEKSDLVSEDLNSSVRNFNENPEWGNSWANLWSNWDNWNNWYKWSNWNNWVNWGNMWGNY